MTRRGAELSGSNPESLASKKRSKPARLPGHDALLRYIAESHPAVAPKDREDVVQTALVKALAEDRTLSGGDLIERAQRHVKEIVQSARDQHRRGARVAAARDGAPDQAPVELMKRRRAPRRLRAPRGTLPVSLTGEDAAVLRLATSGVGDVPDDELKHVAARIEEVTERVKIGLATSKRDRVGLLNAYSALFGTSPKDSWVYPLVDEVAMAKKEQLLAQAPPKAPGTSTAPQHTLTDENFIVIGPPAKATKATPNEHSIKLPATVSVVAAAGDSVCFQLTAQHQGRTYRTFLELSEPSEHPTPRDPLLVARLVLLRCIERLASIPGSVRLPDYALDPQLIAWLVERMGFEGGGGARALAKETIVNLLLDLAALATKVEAHGRRVADRVTDAVAEHAESGFASIARRLRQQAGLAP
jgi:hypothetical protein